jgi:hypothetical protein
VQGVSTVVPAEIRPAVEAGLNAVLPDLLTGHLERILPDIFRNLLPRFPGFGVGGPEQR